LKAEVEEHEKNFATLVQKKAKISEEDLTELESAVEKQDRYVAATGGTPAETNRLENLRTRLHVYRGEKIREETTKLEADANKIIEEVTKARLQKKPTDIASANAVKLLRQALDLETEISQKWVLSSLDDPGRRARLDSRMRRLEADPLWQKGRRLEQEAEAAAATGNFAAAEEALKEAIQIEQNYTLRFRDVRATEFDREEKLRRKLDTIRSMLAKTAIDEIVRQAQAEEAAREWKSAAKSWKAAIDAQANLARSYPQSSYAARTIGEGYSVSLTQVLAMPEVEAFRADMAKLRDLLRDGEVAKASALGSDLSIRADALTRKFPSSLTEKDPDKEQLAFIRQRSASLEVIRDAVVKQLITIPNHKNIRLLRTEVPQSLYVAVMAVNPSAKREINCPVESITYEDAEKFCARVAWLTGLKVRLPDADDYLAAQGDTGRQPTPEEAWTIDTSDGQVRAVGTSKPNPLGFNDLSGNVAEWVRSADSSVNVTLAGGDAQSAPGSTFLFVQVNRREGSRLRGLRLAVDP
jgi:organic radical activating enzyme